MLLIKYCITCDELVESCTNKILLLIEYLLLLYSKNKKYIIVFVILSVKKYKFYIQNSV